MKIVYHGSLQRTMIVYFLLIGFASSVIGTEFIFDVHRKDLGAELMQNFEKVSRHEIQPEEAFHPIQTVRNKAILMVVLMLVVVLILLTMFIKNITEPLQHLIENSKAIAMGDLSRTVTIRARNELAEMGDTVNELTSNLQEMILLSKDLCATTDRFIDNVSETLEEPSVSDLREEMRLLNAKTKLLNDIILNCRFYKIER